MKRLSLELRLLLGIRQVVQTWQAPGRCFAVMIVGDEDEMQFNCTGFLNEVYVCLIYLDASQYFNSTDPSVIHTAPAWVECPKPLLWHSCVLGRLSSSESRISTFAVRRLEVRDTMTKLFA